MEEDNTIKALILGVSVFLIIITLSAVILYYNTAVGGARTISDTRMDIGKLYDKKIEDLDNTTVDGIDMRNILRSKYENYVTVELEIIDIGGASTTITLEGDEAGNVKDSQINMINVEKNYILNISESNTTLSVIASEQ